MNLSSLSPATATGTIPCPPPSHSPSFSSSPSLLSFPYCIKTVSFRARVTCSAVRTGDTSRMNSGGGGGGEEWERWTRRPAPPGSVEEEEEDEDRDDVGMEEALKWVDWEDQILEETIPLVDLARRILHSGNYQNGERLSPRHQRAIVILFLPYHPDYEEKIGCGVDYITIDYHPQFEESRCFFIVRKDGKLVDFSYWKCIKGFIRKRYPLFAESFLLRHFYRRTPVSSGTRTNWNSNAPP